jgi:UDP-N-acetylglucosamine 1-carboxyvinyltransferase
MRAAGAKVREGKGNIAVSMKGRPRPVPIATAPYPGFPTDLQAPWMAWMSLARGSSRIKETVFENRFMHAAELGRMGARIAVSGDTGTIQGVPALSGAPIMASDLRAGAALLVAALSAPGRTSVARVYHIDRGYERVEIKLRSVGARIRRVRS